MAYSRHHVPRAQYRAAQYFETKLADDPSNIRAHKNLAPLLLERAEKRKEPGAAASALRHLKVGCHLDGGDDALRNDFALALLRAGRVEAAVDTLKEGVQRMPRNALLRKNLAAAYARKGRYKEALEHAQEAVRLAPRDPSAQRNVAKLLDQLGNTRDALEHNRRALVLGPGCVTGGRLREARDTETYRVVARQAVARNEYSDGRGSCEQHMDAHRALARKRVDLPFSETTRELLAKAGMSSAH